MSEDPVKDLIKMEIDDFHKSFAGTLVVLEPKYKVDEKEIQIMEQKKNIASKIFGGVLIAVLIFMIGVMIKNSLSVKDIDKYGEWEKSGIHSPLKIFPEKVVNKEKAEYFYGREKGLQNDKVQIYLKCTYSQEQFQEEVERISEIGDTYEGENYHIRYDKDNFKFPAYVAIYGADEQFEYALVDGKNLTIYYVYLQLILEDEIEFDKEVLPKGGLDISETSNIYVDF